MKGLKNGHSENHCHFDCIPVNLNHCVVEPTPGGGASIETQGKVGRVVICRELSFISCFRLPDPCSVFQSEVTAIEEMAGTESCVFSPIAERQ